MKKFLVKPYPIVVAAVAVLSVVLLWKAVGGTDAVPLENENIYKARVLEVLSENVVTEGVAKGTIEQELIAAVEGPDVHENRRVSNDYTPVKKGDVIYVQGLIDVPADEADFYTIGIVRQKGLIWMAVLFAGLTMVVGRYKGLSALVGLLFSLGIIFSFIVPRILSGDNPVLIGIFGAVIILIVTLYISHGFNRVMLSALLGITITLIIVGLLTQFFVGSLYFTGFGTEESFYLNQSTDNGLDLAKLLIVGIMIAAIGVLDDIAITQASTVSQLAQSSADSRRQIYKRAMHVGRDHISAVINTLVLAYVGAALPLILLLTVNSFDPVFVINGELVAEEIARTLLSSSGLVLAVPITTYIAATLMAPKTIAGFDKQDR